MIHIGFLMEFSGTLLNQKKDFYFQILKKYIHDLNKNLIPWDF